MLFTVKPVSLTDVSTQVSRTDEAPAEIDGLIGGDGGPLLGPVTVTVWVALAVPPAASVTVIVTT